MSKQIYMTPEMEITCFEEADIVTTSIFDDEVGEVLNIFGLDLED